MADSGYKVRVEGLDELKKKLDQAPELVKTELRTAMKKSVIHLEGQVKPLTPVGVSSRLRNSIASEVKEVGGGIVGVVGSSLTPREEYPHVMEFGRKPGKRPPTAKLVRWVELKLGVRGDAAWTVAARVASTIAARGIKGRRMFEKGWQKSEKDIDRYFQAALARIVDRL